MFSFFEDHFRISRIYLKKIFPFLGFALHKKLFFYTFAAGIIYY